MKSQTFQNDTTNYLNWSNRGFCLSRYTCNENLIRQITTCTIDYVNVGIQMSG